MKHLWSIEEQKFEDKTTGFTLELTVTYTETESSINNPIGRHVELLLNITNESKTKVVSFKFDQNGQFVTSEIGLTAEDTPDN